MNDNSKYEIRRFKQILGNIIFDPSQSFIDLYLYRKNHIQIGIKFRQPKQKQYGWKVKGFQVKIAQIQKSKQGYQLQKWKKYKLSLDQSIKLRLKKTLKNISSENDHDQKQEQQKQSKDLPIQTIINKKIYKIYSQIVKVFQKSQLKQNKIILDWCNYDFKKQEEQKIKQNLQIFKITKEKQKIGGKQIGKLKVERIIHKFKPTYYQTQCIQSSSPNKILEKAKEWNYKNVSYPKHLYNLFNKLDLNRTKQQQKDLEKLPQSKTTKKSEQ